jgi:hypothetical protein
MVAQYLFSHFLFLPFFTEKSIPIYAISRAGLDAS